MSDIRYSHDDMGERGSSKGSSGRETEMSDIC
jgi:hypothetical protein